MAFPGKCHYTHCTLVLEQRSAVGSGYARFQASAITPITPYEGLPFTPNPAKERFQASAITPITPRDWNMLSKLCRRRVSRQVPLHPLHPELIECLFIKVQRVSRQVPLHPLHPINFRN